MAQFDVYLHDDGQYLLDCQSAVLRDINTRLVAPLRSPNDARIISARLNPTLAVDGERLALLTHFAAAIPVRDLGRPVASLETERYTILAALDFLISGF